METIVIVGGGAGGLELATRLGDSIGAGGHAKIVLVDRSPTHFWKPLLHTVASGKLDPQVHQLDYSEQAANHHFHFMCGEVLRIDRGSRTVEIGPYHIDGIDGIGGIEGGAEVLPQRRVRYDKLVLACGAITNFFHIPGAAEHSLTLDSVHDAESFRKRFLASCMKASLRRAESGAARADAAVNIVIVGGGATGVELAAELRHTVRTLAQYKVHSLDPVRDVRIRIIERGDRLLPQLNPRLSRRAARYLRALGIEVCASTTVARVDADAVHDAAGERHASDMTVWAAGVEAPDLCLSLRLPVNRLKQVAVSPSLQTVGDPGVFALGDCSSYVCPVNGTALPPRAQVAHQQAVFLAEVLSRRQEGPLPAFQYRDYGSLVSLSEYSTVGSLMGNLTGSVHVEGWLARVLYRSLYRLHQRALFGALRTGLLVVADTLTRPTRPRTKLH